MEVIEFKVKITITFVATLPFDQGNKVLCNTLESVCKIFGLQVKKDSFVSHENVELEAAGLHQEGVEYDIQKTLTRLENVYNLAKILEGIAGVLKSLTDYFDHVEFQLL